MTTHPSRPLRRLLSLFLALVMLVTAFAVTLPVSAAIGDGDHNHDEDLDATYGTLIQAAIRGTCDYQMAFETLDILNAERKKAGLPTLSMDKSLLESAMVRAAECAVLYSPYHYRPSGESCFTAVDKRSTLGENIAAGYRSAAAAMDGWLNSPGHRSNILSSRFSSIGIGVFKIDDVYYWCQVFSSLKKQSNPTTKKPVVKTISYDARLGLLDLNINKEKVHLEEDETVKLEISNRNQGFPLYDHPVDASGLTFSSSNAGIAQVSSTGVITPTGDGEATISVKAANGVTLFKVPVSAESTTLTAKISYTSSNKVKISWNKVTGARTYRIYKRVYKDGKWTAATLLKHTTSLSYVDTSVTSGTKVKYTVYAYDGSRKFDSYDTVSTLYLAQPKVKVTNASSGVKVTWDKVAGATSYKVYRSTYSGGKWSSYTAYKTTKATSYTDTRAKSGQRVRYTVYAYNGKYRSATKTGVITTYLSQPKVKVTSASTGTKVTWGKVAGATSYKVYKSEYKSGKWTGYKAVKTTKTTSYVDKKVKSGQKVRYTVYAYNGKYRSATKTGVITTYLSQPKVKLTKATKGVKISWSKVSGATTYKVYRSVYKNGKWSAYTPYKTTKSCSYTDKTIKSKQKVRYMVYAYNGKYKSATKTGVSITR